jgi:putative PIN family toxin of toxin-antitoxin system
VRLVLDTNVVAAGLLWQGPPNRLVEEAFDGKVELATSLALLVELVPFPVLRHRFSAQLT